MTVRCTTIYVLDHVAACRTRLTRMLEAAGYEVLTFESAPDFLKLVEKTACGCIVVNAELPHFDGLRFQKRIGRHRGHMPIIFTSCGGNVSMAVTAMKAGAVDFLVSPFRAESMVDAVGRAMTQCHRTRAHDSDCREMRERVKTLSKREYETFLHLLTGAQNKSIGTKMAITTRTVKAHRGQIMEKLGVKATTQLMDIAHCLGIRSGGETRSVA